MWQIESHTSLGSWCTSACMPRHQITCLSYVHQLLKLLNNSIFVPLAAIFQRDLSALDAWAKRCGMRFNPSKCNIVRIHRSQSLFSKSYELSGVTLEEVEHAKYVGITLSNKLEWGQHVDNITK